MREDQEAGVAGQLPRNLEAVTQFETFVLGLVMASTMDPTREDRDDPDGSDFKLWVAFWDAARPAWNEHARRFGWRFESSLLWNPS